MTDTMPLSWIKALRNAGTRQSLLVPLENHLVAVNKALPEEDRRSDQKIQDVLEKIKIWDSEVDRMFRGEIAEIVDPSDVPCAHTEAGIAHLLGLRHRTANAFVLSPTGKTICQRRAHNKRFGMFLSIYGGHVKMPQTYEEAMREELKEELGLADDPAGEMQFIGKELYEVPGDLNVEFRALFLYRLTPVEYQHVRQNQQALDAIKQERTSTGYKSWLEEQQGTRHGHGEVWSVYEIDTGQLIDAPCENIFVTDLARNAELHYLMVGDRFQDQQTVVDEKAFFTPDLLDRAIRNRAVCKELLAAGGHSQ
ncbi:MAG TPA: NUDIX domain-containing protein [Chthonomonadaceae bacterium]|nr:NUDIX domain-containing protein [Chthonomonadaceae bacterium]